AFENYRRQSRDVHFVRGLGPADQFVAAVQTQRAQNRGGKLGLAPVQIVFAQNKAQRLEREEISAAGIAQNVPPPSGFLHPVSAAASDRRTSSGIDRDAVAATERRRQPGIAIAPGDDLSTGPNLAAQLG